MGMGMEMVMEMVMWCGFGRLIKCLEYDPELPDTHTFDTHTKFIERYGYIQIHHHFIHPHLHHHLHPHHHHHHHPCFRSRFKDVVPIGREAVLEKIRQTFLITYIRDVVLLRHLDDATVGSLNSMHFFNTVHSHSH